MISEETWSSPPSRYNESMLVKKLENTGIGRPSTYANIISTIIQREYVERKNIEGNEHEITIYKWKPKSDNIVELKKKINNGSEKNKLVVSEIGKIVTQYLNDNFPLIMDYNLSIPDIYNIDHSNKNIFSKTIILESDKIYDLDEIFVNLDKVHFTGIYIKTYSTNIYLSTNNFKNVLIYNNFFILDLFNRCNNYYNFFAKGYDSEIEIYIIKKPTTNIQTFNLCKKVPTG
jgi:hypothetical protein